MVVQQALFAQAVDDGQWAIGEMSGPRRADCRAQPVVGRFTLPVRQHCLGQCHLLRNNGNPAELVVELAVQGDGIDPVRVKVYGAFFGPLAYGIGCRPVRARKTGEAVAHILHTLDIYVLVRHEGHFCRWEGLAKVTCAQGGVALINYIGRLGSRPR
ncbi:hypothetical protein D3C81_1360410 [compost metagenome]